MTNSWEHFKSDCPEWSNWLQAPSLKNMWIMSIRRTVDDHLRTRYFPEILVYLP